jgi:hypothetical protein
MGEVEYYIILHKIVGEIFGFYSMAQKVLLIRNREGGT